MWALPQTIKKPIFVSRKGSGNEAFRERNPQSGLCPFEEKGKFKAFSKAGGMSPFIPTVPQKRLEGVA